MTPKPNEPAKPGMPVSKSLLRFLPAGLVRDVAEIIVSGVPGAFVLALLLILTGAFNIYSNLNTPNGWVAYLYLPVVCLLPLVVGIIAPLVLERVRGVDVLSLKRSVLSALFSGFLGSLIGAIGLLVTGLAIANAKPFGASLTGLPIEFVMLLVLVFFSTVLSAIGGAILVLFLSRAMAPKAEG